MSENAAYESDMRRWAIDIWANRVRTIFVDGGCVDQGVSKTALQQKGLRKCMHWYVSCLFCRRTKQHVSRCMLTRTELFDASFASAFRPWTRIPVFGVPAAVLQCFGPPGLRCFLGPFLGPSGRSPGGSKWTPKWTSKRTPKRPKSTRRWACCEMIWDHKIREGRILEG